MSRRTWRDEPPTTAQVRVLPRLARIYGWSSWRVEGVTRGEAADMIDTAKRRRSGL